MIVLAVNDQHARGDGLKDLGEIGFEESGETPMNIGIRSSVAIFPDPATGMLPTGADRMAGVLEEIEHAERVGLDFFGIGEHHRAEFLDSSPVAILAAAAARTNCIRLMSAVTDLNASNPVRIFQDFATLDLISRCMSRSSPGGDLPSELFRCLACS
ncbi:LLM class flavin-dependent oxidoreductase [Teichococcus globiformis]|uniref:LLM class flavin-dependent oxidoreductase n=1 Tax=Teichococcus globiformis TaxID=2307229 RepID=UPI0036D22BBA